MMAWENGAKPAVEGRVTTGFYDCVVPDTGFAGDGGAGDPQSWEAGGTDLLMLRKTTKEVLSSEGFQK